jgi:hypothetical protein
MRDSSHTHDMRWGPRSRTASRITGTVLALGAALTLAGCVTPGVCPAIMWGRTIEITLTGPTEAVDQVRLCVDAACTMEPPAPDEPPVIVESFDPEDFTTFTPAPETSPVEFGGYALRVDDDTWSISMFTGASGEVSVQALSADGVVLAETVTELEFARIGGTEECGGPTRAEVAISLTA